jgi:hypothetical protein|tara:strand:- start:1397 stop:1603 length:207 start_codon:yes stop_codon:yes gene_type:complete
MREQLTKILSHKVVKLLFSASIIVSTIPSIIQDFSGGVNNGYTHYGLMFIGIMYGMESLLWIMDIWKK